MLCCYHYTTFSPQNQEENGKNRAANRHAVRRPYGEKRVLELSAHVKYFAEAVLNMVEHLDDLDILKESRAQSDMA